MSSSIEELERHLPPLHKQRIDDLVDEISLHMDKIVRHEEKIDELIKRFIALCDEIGLPPEQTSRYIKHKLKGIVSDDTIERHLPEERKRKHKPYETYRQLEESRNDTNDEQTSNEVYERPVTVSTSGSQSITGPADGQEKEDEEEIETPEIGGGFTERSIVQETEENEAEIKVLKKRIEQLLLENGELELQLTDLKNEKKSPNNPNELERLRLENEELREVEAIHTKKLDFTPASKLPPSSHSEAWIAASNLSGFIKALVGVSMKFDPFSAQRKVIFDLTDDGQLKNPRPEGL